MTLFIAVLVAVWLLVVIIWWMLTKTMRKSDVDRIKNRLVGVPKRQTQKSSKRDMPLIQTEDLSTGKLVLRLLQRFKLTERLRELIEQAGLKWNVARTIHACLALFLATFALLWVTIPASFLKWAPLPALFVASLPILYLLRKRGKRLNKFEEQFPESLEFVARSMRAGHAFSVSLEMIHKEFQDPLAGEFRRTFEEHNLGLPLEVALQKLANRIPSLDVHFFVSAVLLQKRTGGNLAEILDKLATLIRERFKLRGKIRAISAHGRMTGVALSCIPIGVAVLMFYTNPDYVRFFFIDETGQLMMGAAVALQVVGYLIIRKIVSIEV